MSVPHCGAPLPWRLRGVTPRRHPYAILRANGEEYAPEGSPAYFGPADSADSAPPISLVTRSIAPDRGRHSDAYSCPDGRDVFPLLPRVIGLLRYVFRRGRVTHHTVTALLTHVGATPLPRAHSPQGRTQSRQPRCPGPRCTHTGGSQLWGIARCRNRERKGNSDDCERADTRDAATLAPARWDSDGVIRT